MIMFLLIIICIFAILKWVFWNPWCIYTSHRHLKISKRICKLFMWIWYSHMQNILFLDPRWSTGICIFCSYIFIVFDMHIFYPCAILGGQVFYFLSYGVFKCALKKKLCVLLCMCFRFFDCTCLLDIQWLWIFGDFGSNVDLVQRVDQADWPSWRFLSFHSETILKSQTSKVV